MIDTTVVEPHARTRYQVTFGVIALATTAYSVLQSLVTPVLPTIQAELHTSQSTVTWVLTVYLLAASVAAPIVGRLGDMIGKKRVLVGVLVVLAVGTLMAALATSIGMMIVARAVQGAGGAVLPLAFGIIRDEFPREKVAFAVSTTAALLAVGGGLGTVLAGPIVDAFDYHYLFWLPLVFILVAAVAAQIAIPESRTREPGRISFVPAVLLSAWLIALLLAVSEGSRWGWSSWRTVGLLLLSVVLAACWVFSEIRSPQPLVDMRMMRIPAVWATNIVALLIGAGMYAISGFLPVFVQTPPSAGYGFGASITASGIFLLPFTVAMFCFGLLSGRLAERWGSKLSLLIGSVLTTAGFVLLTLAHSQRWEIYVVSGLLGAGTGFGYAAMSNLIVESVPASQVGVASGMNANIRTLGGAVGAAIVGALVTAGATAGAPPPESGYTHGFMFLAICLACAVAATVMIPSRRPAMADLARSTEGQILVRNGEAALVPGAPIVEVE